MLKLKLQQFAAPGSLSALREATFDKLELNVGIFIKNFDYSALADAGDVLDAIDDEIESGSNLLGVTYGGGTFNVSRELRDPQIDGLRYKFKFGQYVDSTDPYMTTTLKECTPENFAIALGGEIATSGKKKTIRMRTALNESAYLDNLCWVGELSNGDLVLIRLDNAINTANFTFTFTDKGEGSFGVEFHATQASVQDYDYAPFEVVFFGTDGDMGSLTVTSVAGTNVGETALSTTYTLGSNEKFVYKIGTAGAAPSAVYHEYADYSWTEWDGTSAVDVGTSANSKKATVTVLDSSGRFILSGAVTLAVKTA